MRRQTSCYVCIPAVGEHDSFLGILEPAFDEVVVHPGPDRPTRAELKRVGRSHDAAVCGVAETFDAEVAAAADRLSVLGTLSTGRDHLDVEALQRAGVTVVDAAGANAVSVAEHTWTLILALSKRLVEANEAVRTGEGRDGLARWPTELDGKTLGVVGAGPIAHEVLRRAEGFGVEPLVWTFHPDQHPEIPDLGGTFVDDLTDLVERSHVVTVHVPLSNRSRGLLDPTCSTACRPTGNGT